MAGEMMQRVRCLLWRGQQGFNPSSPNDHLQESSLSNAGSGPLPTTGSGGRALTLYEADLGSILAPQMVPGVPPGMITDRKARSKAWHCLVWPPKQTKTQTQINLCIGLAEKNRALLV